MCAAKEQATPARANEAPTVRATPAPGTMAEARNAALPTRSGVSRHAARAASRTERPWRQPVTPAPTSTNPVATPATEGATAGGTGTRARCSKEAHAEAADARAMAARGPGILAKIQIKFT